MSTTKNSFFKFNLQTEFSDMPIGFLIFWQAAYVGRIPSKGVATDKTVDEKIAIIGWK